VSISIRSRFHLTATQILAATSPRKTSDANPNTKDAIGIVMTQAVHPSLAVCALRNGFRVLPGHICPEAQEQ
jgi:hypothetical protein